MSQSTDEAHEGEHTDDERLLAALEELVGRTSREEAAALLGVSVRTVIRTASEKRLTPRMRDTLTLRLSGDEEADQAVDPARTDDEDLARRLTRIETRVEALEATTGAVREAPPATGHADPEGAAPDTGASMRAATTPPLPGVEQPVIGRTTATKPRRPHPELVTLEAEDGEALLYGRAAPLIAEWRRVRAGHLDQGRSRVEQARDWVRMCELELALIGEHGLTLPPDSYPWDRFQRRDALRHRELWLGYARAERRRAVVWRSLRRVLTLGVWRR